TLDLYVLHSFPTRRSSDLMQKDTWLTEFNSVAIHPEGLNVPVHVDVSSVTVNDMVWDKYLDVGLYDTMHDLFVNFIGAVVFSIRSEEHTSELQSRFDLVCR